MRVAAIYLVALSVAQFALADGSYSLHLDVSGWASAPELKVLPRPLEVKRDGPRLHLRLSCGKTYSLTLASSSEMTAFDAKRRQGECVDVDLVASPRSTRLVMGALRNQFRQAVPGAWITVGAALGGTQVAGVREVFPNLVGHRVETSASGAFFLPLTEAMYPILLLVEAPEHSATEVKVEDPKALRNMSLKATRWISGEVWPKLSDLPEDVMVRCEFPSEPPRRGCGYAPVAADGHFRLDAVPIGNLHISLVGPSGWSRTSGVDVDEAESFVTLHAEAGSRLVGRVTDSETREGVPDVDLLIIDAAEYRPVSAAATGPDGSFVAWMIEPSDVLVQIRDGRYFDKEVRVTLDERNATELDIEIRPIEFANVSARILLGDGSPVGDAVVSAHDLTTSRSYTATADASGTARFRVPITQSLRLSVVGGAPGLTAGTKILDVSNAGEYEATIVALRASTLTGSLAPSACPSQPVVWLRSQDGTNLRARIEGRRFLFRGLQPGTGELVVSCESVTVVSAPVTIHAGEHQDLGQLVY